MARVHVDDRAGRWIVLPEEHRDEPRPRSVSTHLDVEPRGQVSGFEPFVGQDAERRTNHEMAVATEPLDTPVGVIDKGTVAAQRFTWEGTVDGDVMFNPQTAEGAGL